MIRSSIAYALVSVVALVAGCGAGGDDQTAATQSNLGHAASGFAGGFAPRGGVSGFGGGTCTASKTPIVFLHGNGDDATSWNRPASNGGPSVLAALESAGYRDCELYGLTWLTPAELLTPELIYHDTARATQLRNFLNDVRSYTGQSKVDIVAHSMGVTLALHALEGSGQIAGLRRFVSIAGGLRGLNSCLVSGAANPLVTTCDSQNLFDSNTFGFYPTANPRMQSSGFRARPASSPGVSYYSIRAGSSDEILCATSEAGCESALFTSGANVIAQLDVGEGLPIYVVGNYDSTGVGHFRARSDSGPLLVKLLSTTCTGASCCTGIAGTCTQ